MARSKSDGYGNYEASADDLDKMIGALPPIRGTWFFVDPTSGSASNDGLTPGSAFASISSAYTACTDGQGDGIALMSAGTTSAGTTSYLTAALTWAKSGITVLGMASGSRMESRARIANASTTTNIANLITMSGSNNKFENISMFNAGSNVASVGCLVLSGHRNAFKNCHFVGAGHATPAAATGANDVKIDGGIGNTFEKCIFGTDTIIRAAANGNIAFDGTACRNAFYDCDVVCYSETAGKGAIISADATAFQGVQIFSRCRFIAWKPNGLGSLTSAFIGTKPNSGQLLMDSCSLLGWAAWDSVGGNDTVYVANSNATASGAGGIATTV